MQEWYLGWEKVLFREVSSVQECPHRERGFTVHYALTNTQQICPHFQSICSRGWHCHGSDLRPRTPIFHQEHLQTQTHSKIIHLCSIHSGTSLIRTLQWGRRSVIVSEVSSFQRLKCMQEWYLGWEKVSCLERCPQFRSVLIERERFIARCVNLPQREGKSSGPA